MNLVSISTRSFCSRHPLFIFVILPIFILVIITISSGAAEIFLDHFLLGRAENGMPILYTLSWARFLITGWNLAVVYAAPVLIALTMWKIGIVQDVSERWLRVGALTICLFGGLHNLDAKWTGAKGTSTLVIGPISDLQTGLIRIALNLLLVAAGIIVLRRWSKAQP